MSEPLKGKLTKTFMGMGFVVEGSTLTLPFKVSREEDIKSAVEWLKEKIPKNCEGLFEEQEVVILNTIIDKAFEDVTFKL